MAEPWVHAVPSSPPASGRNPFAVPALVPASLAVLVSMSSRVFAVLTPRLVSRSAGSIHSVVTVITVLSAVELVLALAAIGLGAAGLLRRDAPRGLVAAAFGIGVTMVALSVLNRVSSVVMSSIGFR